MIMIDMLSATGLMISTQMDSRNARLQEKLMKEDPLGWTLLYNFLKEQSQSLNTSTQNLYQKLVEIMYWILGQRDYSDMKAQMEAHLMQEL